MVCYVSHYGVAVADLADQTKNDEHLLSAVKVVNAFKDTMFVYAYVTDLELSQHR